MPRKNGFTLIKKLKSIDKKRKAYFLTAFEIEKEDLIRNNIITDTIDCFIKKPILLSDFIKKVIALLKQSSIKKRQV